MASIFDNIWNGIKALARNGLIGINNPLPAGTQAKLAAIKDPSDLFYFITTEALLPKEVVDHFLSITTYANVEKSGLNPKDWFISLPDIEKGKIKYGPEEYEQAVRFFGNWTKLQAVMYLIAVLSAIAIVALGIGPATSSAIEATRMMRAGTAVGEIYEFLKVKNLTTLPRLLIPGITAGVAWLGGQLAQTQLTATGDLLTYMKKGVADSETALEKMKRQGSSGSGAIYAPQADVQKTRVTTGKPAKPVVIYGTLFSSVVKRTDVFERQIDDEITSKEDLRVDAQANLQRWLQTLPSRLIYTIDVRQNPYDELGVRQTGTWLTMTLLIRHISGATQPIDTIMLGPVNPVVYVPRSADIESIQYELPGLLSAKEIAEVVLGNQTLRVADAQGNIAPVKFGGAESQPPEIPQPAAATPSQTTNPSTRSFVRFVGSPNIFFRTDGRYLPQAEAQAKGVNTVSDVEDIPTPRPEVKTGADFALWDGKDLSMASVPGVGFTPPAPAAATAPPIAPTGTEAILLNYSEKNGSGQITQIDPARFPAEYQTPGTQFADGRTRFTTDFDNKAIDYFTAKSGLDRAFVANILFRLLTRQVEEANIRSDSRLGVYGSPEDVAANFGDYLGLAVFLLNGDRYISFQGSPNVFSLPTGTWVSSLPANAHIYRARSPRPAVTTVADYARLNNISLSSDELSAIRSRYGV